MQGICGVNTLSKVLTPTRPCVYLRATVYSDCKSLDAASVPCYTR